MPNVDLVATKDFSYRTRRLKAGDTIPDVKESDAKVLIAIGKAKHQRVAGRVAPPPAEVAAKAAEVTPAAKATAPQTRTESAKPRPVAAVSTQSVKATAPATKTESASPKRRAPARKRAAKKA